MKLQSILVAMLLGAASVTAQTTDPVIMTINGEKVTRSEFEYSYNKNNTEGVIDKKSVKEYIPLFVNYKLKVAAAKAARLDTLSSFKKEFLGYRNQQIRPAFITDADVEAEARKIYEEARHRIDSMGGLVKTAHILLMARQQDPQSKWDEAQRRADSLYAVLKKGGDFAALAKEYSQDPGSARNGGDLGWQQRGVFVKEFEDAAFGMKKGELSKPVRSAFGFHLIKVLDKGPFFPYDSVKTDIYNYITQRGLREQIINQKLDTLVKAAPGTTVDELMEAKLKELEQKDPSLRYLVQEYYDGLLLYEISNRTVWDKAAKDEQGLERYFKKNKKKYRYGERRFKGIAYAVKDKADIEKVKQAIKKVPFAQWGETLRSTFNSDSVQVRVEKGIFKPGDNNMIDLQVFGVQMDVPANPKFPYSDIYGKLIKAPETLDDVRGLVVSDYQESLEKDWVEHLNKAARIEINQDVVETVNKH